MNWKLDVSNEGRAGVVKVVTKQFPFIVAEALTYNKSQGDSYECVVAHTEHLYHLVHYTLHLVELRQVLACLLLVILN